MSPRSAVAALKLLTVCLKRSKDGFLFFFFFLSYLEKEVGKANNITHEKGFLESILFPSILF